MSATEIIQRNELTTVLLREGYNVFIPVYDEGIDLIAHRESDDDLKLIQQKSRWTIMQKYVGRNIWIAFRDRGEWYLAPHDEMISHAIMGRQRPLSPRIDDPQHARAVRALQIAQLESRLSRCSLAVAPIVAQAARELRRNRQCLDT